MPLDVWYLFVFTYTVNNAILATKHQVPKNVMSRFSADKTVKNLSKVYSEKRIK